MRTQAARKASLMRQAELDAIGCYLTQRVDKYIISKTHKNFKICDSASKAAKSLYNSVNYYCRGLYTSGEDLPSYSDLDSLCKNPPSELKHFNYHYRRLLSQSAQQLLIQLREDWSNYFKARKAYYSDPTRFLGEPKIPGWKRKRATVIIPQSFAIKDGRLIFYSSKGMQPLSLRENRPYGQKAVCQIRIIPLATCYKIEVVYEVVLRKVSQHVTSLIDADKRIIGLDLGVNNFLACANNVGLQPFVIDGRELKSFNRLYNKVKATIQKALPYRRRLQSIAPEFIGPKKLEYKQQKWSNQLDRLTVNRQLRIDDYLHKISRLIVDYCIFFKIDLVIAGYNCGWKQEVNNNRKNNQNFTYLPHRRFLDILVYKLAEAGISYQETEEAYTSKCSFLDEEQMRHQDEYCGKRVYRGLFSSREGILINADINGAYNIIRKVCPTAFDAWKSKGSSGCGLHPVKLRELSRLSFNLEDSSSVTMKKLLRNVNSF